MIVSSWQDWKPADFKGLLTLRSKNQTFSKAHGPLYPIAMWGKETPWRNAMVAGWKGLTASERNRMVSLVAAPGSKKVAVPTCSKKEMRLAAKSVHKAGISIS